MAKARANKPWLPTAERYVAYIDIMGFKNMVMRVTHEELYSKMKSIKIQMNNNAKISWRGTKPGHDMIKSTSYSDSIILYSKDNTEVSLRCMINTVAALTNDLFDLRIPHKGALAYGKMTLDLDNSIFFGEPLIDAYLLQEELKFYGTILHGSAEKRINGKVGNYFLYEYLCPLEKGNAYHLTIIPIFLEDDENCKKEQESLFQSLKHFKQDTSGYLRRYIDNTTGYFNHVTGRTNDQL